MNLLAGRIFVFIIPIPYLGSNLTAIVLIVRPLLVKAASIRGDSISANLMRIFVSVVYPHPVDPPLNTAF